MGYDSEYRLVISGYFHPRLSGLEKKVINLIGRRKNIVNIHLP